MTGPSIEIHHYHHFPDASGGDTRSGLHQQLAALENTLMTVSAPVQELLTLAQQNATLVGSVSSAMQALSLQVANQSTQITELQAQLAAGGTIGADDLNAIAESSSDLQTSITQLSADIPTNVTSVGGPAAAAKPADPGVAQAAASQQEADSNAASQAQPIAGTGKAPDGTPLVPGQSQPATQGQPAGPAPAGAPASAAPQGQQTTKQ